jgi:1,4-alpha-glucan branching enzyme
VSFASIGACGADDIAGTGEDASPGGSDATTDGSSLVDGGSSSDALADAPETAPGDAAQGSTDGTVADAAVPSDAANDAPSDAGIPLGATPGPAGVTFRVWAPNATAVAVRGPWDQWSAAGTPLAPEDGGTYSGTVAAAATGDEYEYVLTNSGTILHRADPRSRVVTKDAGVFGNSVVVDPAAYAFRNAFTPPPPSDAIIYELHVETFDGSPGTGTWASATAKLDYLKALGVTFVETMPVAEVPENYSWGYDPSFPFAAEPAIGSPDDMKRFIDEAHARGIGVIVDVVHNHYGPDLGRSLWQFDGETFDAGGIYFYTDWRGLTPWGPRPDYGRPEVRQYIVDNTAMWLGEFHADGLRWDSVVNIREAQNGGTTQPIDMGIPLLQQATTAAHAVAPGSLQIAEDLQDDDAITNSVANGGAGFDSQWDDSFCYSVRAALTAVSDSDRDMASVASAVSHSYSGVSTARVVFTDDHDQDAPQNGGQRLANAICGNLDASCLVYAEKRTVLGGVLVLTSPGIPMLFQGQEFVESLPFPFGAGAGIDWSKATTYAGIVQLYTDLIALRRNATSTTRGLAGKNLNVFHADNGAKLLAYHRWDQGGAGDDVIVVLNFGNAVLANVPIGLPRAGTWHVRINTDDTKYSSLFAGTASTDVVASGPAMDGLAQSGTLTIGAYSALLLSQ